ncbi:MULTISPECIES: DNA translocase FtsK [unclassified Paracoccus (in: a-proteobacteria)]|uniref:DNA translocase FtsK n=1 Tax=unclassified Paracoccus (in: a-proteobacteria) TaxID=2688777 RepID=UPI0021E1873D|nr:MULTISPECIES: DNA translocase FtsK [unclassified Paracoccus (in: a-proteobacteria)]UXU75863.1 DNA translocase FtsK [Paracoccus sp. SMMA_5]UXU81772.1 DNA translocase FtsK [Paracoccus sp. SMMA_5_TC]
MASWQAKHRDPLLDQTTRAALERRSKEGLGALLVALGVVIAAMLLSYSPDDPSFMSATDQEAQNYLGRPGAYIASALFMITGFGSWVLVLGALAWGLRLMLHRGEERLIRGVFLPIAMVLVSVYATSLTPPPGWTQSFGLGGHLGDMLMGGMLSAMPMRASIAIKILALLTAIGAVAFLAFVLGFDRRELTAIGGFLRQGLATARLLALLALDRVARLSQGTARQIRDRAEARRQRVSQDASAQLPGSAGTALPGLPRAPRVHDPVPPAELIEPETHYAEDAAAPSAEEIDACIKDALRHRGEPRPAAAKAGLLAAVGSRLSGALARGDAGTAADADTDAEGATDAAPPRPFGAGTARVVVPPARPAPPSRQAQAEAEPAMRFDAAAPAYEHPPLSLLAAPATVERHQLSQEALMENARMLEAVLDDYGVKGQITEVRPGPVVTLYELEPAPGLKASRVIGLADDIARSMSALSARVSTVPGRSVIGIELPNARREKVVLREILSSRAYGDGTQPLPLALGKDIGGGPVVANLAKMPHLLIAGTTGSGKSVAINTMILSLLYKLTPEECRLIMIDPKMLELSVYDGIPHLLSPVVTDPKKAVVALKWVVGEMEERYRKMSKMGVRNIEGYNGRVREALDKGELFRRTVQTGFDEDTGEPVFETEEFQPETFPYIVVIVDEMADLMMVAGKEIEACIQRLAQMARASGIHLIMATQRPSVDVITGTIKANFPTRISFQVTSKIDSRTILGEQGAEQLLGQGDMLYMAGGSRITRVHGPFVSDEEVEEVVNHLKSFGPPSYMAGVVEGPDEDRADSIDQVLGLASGEGGDAELYDLAVAIVAKDRKCSTSYIQRKLAIGYNKAARLVEQMEEQGIVSPANHVGKREVLVPEV